MSVKDFVTEYIQREYTVPEDVDIMTLNYVESGYVDSLGLVQFIATIEDEFGIEFTDDELEDTNIKVVGGLVSTIEKKIAQ
ncbi:MAG: acyl carrier protein [Lachnospiraceae bacterium]|nr:acyl carrier protein [Lachnospiraceae bacterium]